MKPNMHPRRIIKDVGLCSPTYASWNEGLGIVVKVNLHSFLGVNRYDMLWQKDDAISNLQSLLLVGSGWHIVEFSNEVRARTPSNDHPHSLAE